MLTMNQLRNFNLSSLNAPIFEYDLAGNVYDPGAYSAAQAPLAIQGATNYFQYALDTDYGSAAIDLRGDYGASRYFFGQSQAQTVVDGNGNSTTVYYVDHGIQGTSGSDVIADATGNNVIHAGAGNDLVMTGSGDDGIMGGSGADKIFSGAGQDLVHAGSGQDVVYAGADDDNVRGGGGHDEIYGEAGNDTLKGNNGRDLIDGGAGLDILTGGRHADTFVFRDGSGEDIITDFTAGEDIIRLMASTGATNFADVTNVAMQVGSDVVLRLESGDSVVIEDIALAQLSASDFEFV